MASLRDLLAGALVICSNEKLPFSVWPATVSSAGVPGGTPVTSTRRYGPFGRSSVIGGEVLSSAPVSVPTAETANGEMRPIFAAVVAHRAR